MVVLGCVETEPLCTEKDSEVDARLIGTWQTTSDSPMIEIAQKGELLTCLVKGIVEEPMVVHMKKIGQHDYCTVSDMLSAGQDKPPKLADAKPAAPKLWQCSYRYVCASKDTIEIFELDGEKVAKVIKFGDLKGEIKYSEYRREAGKPQKFRVDNVVLKSRAAELVKYLTDHPDDCFETTRPSFTLHRVVAKAK
jgi:hypothetical protein